MLSCNLFHVLFFFEFSCFIFLFLFGYLILRSFHTNTNISSADADCKGCGAKFKDIVSQILSAERDLVALWWRIQNSILGFESGIFYKSLIPCWQTPITVSLQVRCRVGLHSELQCAESDFNRTKMCRVRLHSDLHVHCIESNLQLTSSAQSQTKCPTERKTMYKKYFNFLTSDLVIWWPWLCIC